MGMKKSNMMKTILMAVLVFGMACGAQAGVIAYWDFSSDSNGVTDATGNYNTLTNIGVTINNGAAIFDGNQTKFSTARALNLQGYGNLTVEFFMRTTNTASIGMLIEHSTNANNNVGAFSMDVNEAPANGIRSFLRCWGTGNGIYHLDQTTNNVAVNGQWHHVAMVYTKTPAAAFNNKLYFDGVEQSAMTGYSSTNLTSLTNNYFYIGSRANNLFKYKGEMDDIRISDAALAPSQFLTTRTEGTLPVIANWRFNEGAGLTDSSTNNKLLTGSGVVFTNGVARFNGVNNSLNTATTLNLTNYTDVTVECFMRTASLNTMIFLEHGVNFYADKGAFMFVVNDGVLGLLYNAFRTLTTYPNDKYHQDQTTANAAADGQWHHVAWVYSKNLGTTNMCTLYLDGVQQPQHPTATDATATPLRDLTFYIGSRANSAVRFIGDLDDIKITARALAPGQFQRVPSTTLPEVIAYWPFSNRAPLSDASGNGHSLTNAGVSFDKDVAVFNGTQTAFSTYPWTLNLRPYSALTVEYFIRTTSTALQTPLMHSADLNVSRGGFNSTINEVNVGQLQCGFSMAGGFDNYNVDGTTSPYTFLDGRWHHVAIVYDPNQSGDNRVRLYFDHTQQTGKPYGALLSSDAETPFLNDILYIGLYGLNALYKFVGELDDVKITGAALTTGQFMQSHSSLSGLVILIK